VKWASDRQKPSKSKPESAPLSRNKVAEMAAEALMSGALPASKKQQTFKQNPAGRQTSKSAEGSVRSSDVGFRGLFEASSKGSSTIVSMKSLSEAVKSVSQNSKNTAASSHRESIGTANKQTYSKRSPDRDFQAVNKDWPDAKTPSSGGFRVVGEGWVQAPASVEEPKQSRTKLRVPSVEYDSTARSQKTSPYSDSEYTTLKVKVASAAQSQASSSAFAQPYNIDGEYDWHRKLPDTTVFAGKGWISPHPLSRAASPSTSPPQSHISLPYSTPNGRDISYDEWRAIQDGQMEHSKRFSREESAISSSGFAIAASIARAGPRGLSTPGACPRRLGLRWRAAATLRMASATWVRLLMVMVRRTAVGWRRSSPRREADATRAHRAGTSPCRGMVSGVVAEAAWICREGSTGLSRTGTRQGDRLTMGSVGPIRPPSIRRTGEAAFAWAGGTVLSLVASIVAWEQCVAVGEEFAQDMRLLKGRVRAL